MFFSQRVSRASESSRVHATDMFRQERLQVALKTMASNRPIKGICHDQRLEERTLFPAQILTKIVDYWVLESCSVSIAKTQAVFCGNILFLKKDICLNPDILRTVQPFYPHGWLTKHCKTFGHARDTFFSSSIKPRMRRMTFGLHYLKKANKINLTAADWGWFCSKPFMNH